MQGDDVPLEPLEPGTATVIDFAGVRIQHGRTPPRRKRCEHRDLLYCPSERRIWCRDCDATVDGFDAFVMIAGHFREMAADAAANLYKTEQALSGVARLRATKTLDRCWSGHVMAPCCPHCRGGLLPEDFADGAVSSVSAEIERARRKRAKEARDA